MDINNVPQVIAACCILHNLCEIHGDSFDEAWLEDNSFATSSLVQPTTSENSDSDGGQASEIRSTLVAYLRHN